MKNNPKNTQKLQDASRAVVHRADQNGPFRGPDGQRSLY